MSMRGIKLSLGLAAAVALAASPSAQADQTVEAETFAFAIGNGMLAGGPDAVAERLEGFDLVVVDGEEASGAEVAALRAGGATVLAYLSVGTIEKWRSWFDDVKRYRLRAWQDWKDEWFADVSKAGLRRVLANQIAPRMLAKGFDGLFLDNVDMIEPRSHRKQRTGMRLLVSELEALNGLLFAQNGFWGLRKFDILPMLSGWNREDVTWTWDFDRKRYVRNSNRHIGRALTELEKVGAMGIDTTATDYTRRSRGPAVVEAVANACSAGALPYVGDIGMTAKRLPNPADMTCPLAE